MTNKRLIPWGWILLIAASAASCSGEDKSASDTAEKPTHDEKTATKTDTATESTETDSSKTDDTDTGENDEEDSKTQHKEEAIIESLKQLSAELAQRRADLDAREREINLREQLVGNLEDSALSKCADLKNLKKETSELLSQLEKKAESTRQERTAEFEGAVKDLSNDREERIAHLVSTVKGMRAAAGAGILASMDERDAVDVLRQLSAKQAAIFLGAMPSEKAAGLAGEMIGPKVPPAGILSDSPKKEVDTEKEGSAVE